MSAIDDELLNEAEEDAREIEFIRNYLPLELKEKFSDDELYYFLDVIIDYYMSSDILNVEPDKDGYVEIDLDEVTDYVVAKAKKEKMGEYEHEDILLVVQAEIEYSEQIEEEEWTWSVKREAVLSWWHFSLFTLHFLLFIFVLVWNYAS